MESLDINTILQITTIVLMGIGGFWFKMIFAKLDSKQSKEICKILHEQNDKDHGGLKTDINGVGAKISKSREH